ncbi:MAG: lamin tail domain-containing protein [Deltaproteobacteria bacterium]|nr:lamin tail domain-containing protein [Deltaproteobacteria bacterium]
MNHLRQNSCYWSLFLVLVVGFGLAGCGDDEGDPTCDPACDANLCMTCQDGACATTCTAGQTCDGSGTCVADTTCDPACDANLCMACVDGTCESTCTTDQICDAGTCVADNTCDPACDADLCMICDAGTCVTSCTVGQTCDGSGTCVADTTCDNIAALRGMEDGVVMDPAMPMCPAYVTYITDRGFFLQTDPEGPAIYSFEEWNWNDENLLAVGDYITMPVIEVDNYFSQKQITVHAAFEIISSGNSVAGLVQDLSSGILPSEELECELINLTGATITLLDGSDLTIAYGTATNVNLYADNLPLTLCTGATFDFLGLAADFDGVHNLRSYDAGDFSNINTDNCPDLGRVPVAGDLLLNEFMADPANDLAGDANCDGIRDSNGVQDEFVEIVNVSGEDLDLSGVTIADEYGPRHTFRGFSLPTGGVVVVFGGGSPDCNWHTNVLAVVATSGALGLNNGGDTITLTAADASTELLTHTYGNEGGNNESLTLSPDLNTGNPYAGHSTADTVDGSLFSPGTTIEGGILGN